MLDNHQFDRIFYWLYFAPEADMCQSVCLQDELGLDIGRWTAEDGVRVGQIAPANANTFTDWQQCLNACDDDHA
jgi:hypothetical protein